MRSTVAQSVGVDISKDALDVAIHPGGESFRITNNPEGAPSSKSLKGSISLESFSRRQSPTIACSNRRLSRPVCLGSRSIPVSQTLCPSHRKLAKTDRCDALYACPHGGAVLDLETLTRQQDGRGHEGTSQRPRRAHQGPRRSPQPPGPSLSRPHQNASLLSGCGRLTARSKRLTDASKPCATQIRTRASA